MARTEDIFATHALLEAIEATPALKGATLSKILARSSGLRTVYQGVWNGEPVIFRHQSGPDAKAIIEKESAEIERVKDWMSAGDFRTIEALFCDPDLGLLVLSQAPGASVRHAIREAPDRRSEFVKQSAQWLAHYTKDARKMAKFPHERYLTRAVPIIEKKLVRRHKGLWQSVLERMTRMVPETTQRDCVLAQTHGDFHPSNVMVDGPLMTGFDLGGSHFIPLAKDASRFLVSLEHAIGPSEGPRHFGVNRAEFDLFCDALDFDAQQREVYFPFLIGFDILHRGPARKSKSSGKLASGIALAQAYLDQDCA
ncbi:phosphotransferase [Algirhabdus cladophorae]|uniref:phosphotransferase n=1 Tax=Algirhabdus cladophorae TaxID=3377108 RepID=UPI003B8452B7